MPTAVDADQLLKLLGALHKAVPTSEPDVSAVPQKKLAQLRTELREVADRLDRLSHEIGPMKLPTSVFDPTDPHVVGQLIGETLLKAPRGPLGAVDRFYGSGVYALYYLGTFDAYEPISRTDTPIYVGKADPADRYAKTVQQQGDRLARRLGDHKKSVEAAENLNLSEFECRFLVVKTAWESTAEDYLINLFRPVWNNEMKVCYGFGKHGDAAGTRGNTRSPWDTLHPGRSWASGEGNKTNPLGVAGVKKAIAGHYTRNPPLHPEKTYLRAKQA